MIPNLTFSYCCYTKITPELTAPSDQEVMPENLNNAGGTDSPALIALPGDKPEPHQVKMTNRRRLAIYPPRLDETHIVEGSGQRGLHCTR